MSDTHSYSFFGQKVGLIIQSSSKAEPFIFFRFIKSKGNGSWEKPSSGEGKAIKFSLEEIVWIVRVLSKGVKSWSTFHKYKDKKTQISFKWEDGENVKLWIHIDSYSKVLDYAQFKILEMLLNHILEEKIEFATAINNSIKLKAGYLSSNLSQEKVVRNNTNIINQKTQFKNKDFKKDNQEVGSKIKSLDGTIKGETEKALLIQLSNNSEIWIPKSTIHSEFNISQNLIQKFTIDSWILEKNKVIS